MQKALECSSVWKMPNVLQRIVPQENMDTPWTMSHLSYRLWTNMSWTFWHYSYKRTEPFHNSTNILKYFNHVRQLFNASWTSSVLQFGQLKHSILYGHRPITLNNPIQSCSTKLVLQINRSCHFYYYWCWCNELHWLSLHL